MAYILSVERQDTCCVGSSPFRFGETDLIMTLIFGLRLPIRKGTGSSNK